MSSNPVAMLELADEAGFSPSPVDVLKFLCAVWTKYPTSTEVDAQMLASTRWTAAMSNQAACLSHLHVLSGLADQARSPLYHATHILKQLLVRILDIQLGPPTDDEIRSRQLYASKLLRQMFIAPFGDV